MLGAQEIRKLLQEAFDPIKLEVTNDSGRHKRHREAQEHGGGHYTAWIVSDAFEGQSRIDRHMQIYNALGMPRPEIHALSIRAQSPDEAKKTEGL